MTTEPLAGPARSRDEHLALCQRRAIDSLPSETPMQVFAQFIVDLRAHPETADLINRVRTLSFPLLTGGFLDTVAELTDHINSFK